MSFSVQVTSLSVTHRDEVVAELLGDHGALLGGHGLGVRGDDDGLDRLDEVQAPRALLGSHHLVVAGDVHVPAQGGVDKVRTKYIHSCNGYFGLSSKTISPTFRNIRLNSC